jgi:hypothetical protein
MYTSPDRMGQNITNTSVSEYEEFQMEEIVPDFILVTTYFILAVIWSLRSYIR